MKRWQEGSHKYVRLTVKQSYFINLRILDLDVETVTLICRHHGEGISFREIAQRLYNECRVQVTSGALTRIQKLLNRGREQILTAGLGKDDLNKYPEIARTAISSILSRYAPMSCKDPKNGRPEVNITEEAPPKDDNGPLLYAEKVQEERHVTIPATPSVHPKSCPRCTGSMLFEEDMHGAYSTCLSCGYVYEPDMAQILESHREEEKRNPARHRYPLYGGRQL
ncbi:hypothetical protein IH981_00960 [Patescibacteria group bacterium]|nr:hypothetical protein [Patescibacteria group bacterium]